MYMRDALERFSALQRAEIAEIMRDRIELSELTSFSALQRAEIAEMVRRNHHAHRRIYVSVLFNEPKLLKCLRGLAFRADTAVSVLFNEPKLLK